MMLVGLLFASLGVWAQGYTVKCSQAGTLKDVLSQETQDTCTYLIVEGELNSQDIKLLRRMGGYDDGATRVGKLQFLDLRGATCVPDTAAYLQFDVKDRDIVILAYEDKHIEVLTKRYSTDAALQEYENSRFEFNKHAMELMTTDTYIQTTYKATRNVGRTDFSQPMHSTRVVDRSTVTSKNGNILLDFTSKVKDSQVKKAAKRAKDLRIDKTTDSYVVSFNNPLGQFTETMFTYCESLSAVAVAVLPNDKCTKDIGRGNYPYYSDSKDAERADYYIPKDVDLYHGYEAKRRDRGIAAAGTSTAWKPTMKMLQTTYESEDGTVLEFLWNGLTLVYQHPKSKESGHVYLAELKDGVLQITADAGNIPFKDPLTYRKTAKERNRPTQINAYGDDGNIYFENQIYRPASVDESKDFTHTYEPDYRYKPQICEDPTTPATIQSVTDLLLRLLRGYTLVGKVEGGTGTYVLTGYSTGDGILAASHWEEVETSNPSADRYLKFLSVDLPNELRLEPATKDGKPVTTKVTIGVEICVDKDPVSLKLTMNGSELIVK